MMLAFRVAFLWLYAREKVKLVRFLIFFLNFDKLFTRLDLVTYKILKMARIVFLYTNIKKQYGSCLVFL